MIGLGCKITWICDFYFRFPRHLPVNYRKGLVYVLGQLKLGVSSNWLIFNQFQSIFLERRFSSPIMYGSKVISPRIWAPVTSWGYCGLTRCGPFDYTCHLSVWVTSLDHYCLESKLLICEKMHKLGLFCPFSLSQFITK